MSGQAVSKVPEEVGGGVGGAIVAIALAYYFYSRYFAADASDQTKNTAAIDLEMAGDQIPKSDDIPSPLFPEAGAKAPAAPSALPGALAASKKPTEPEFQASL